MGAFVHSSNPFYILGVSVRNTADEIAEAYENEIIDGEHDEQSLLQAHQALIGPKTRLEAELSWLPELSPSRARELLSLLETGSTADEIVSEIGELTGLSLVNIWAGLCSRFPGRGDLVETLIENFDEVSVENAVATINESRSVSGFPTANQDLVAEILPKISEAHARTAVDAISRAEHPGLVMTEIVEDLMSETGPARDFLDEVGNHYDSWSAPRLREIKDKIDVNVELLRAEPEATTPVSLIEELLDEWDEYSQPCQLLEEAKGLDERRSKELSDELRELCLWLSNEKNVHDAALRISKALVKTFPELPSVMIQSSDDIDALETLVDEAKAFDLFSPLIEAVQNALEHLENLNDDLLMTSFSKDGRGLAKELYLSFIDAAIAANGTKHASMPWMMVRGVAIELNNSASSTEEALKIIRSLRNFSDADLPADVKEQLDIDLTTMRSNLKWQELISAAEKEDIKAGVRLANELLATPLNEEEQLTAEKLKGEFENRLRSRKRARIFWGVAAVVVVFFVIKDEIKSNKRQSYTARPSTSTTATASYSSSLAEERPPIGSGRSLTTNQVRYCVFQRARLVYLKGDPNRNMTASKFNRLVDDYNSRCSDYKYQRGVLQRVKRELEANRTKVLRGADLIAFSSSSRTTPYNGPRLLDIQSKNNAILVQKQLAKLGYYTSIIDGIWGKGSKTALQSFKARNGLGYSNVWDRETQKKLFPGKNF